MIETADQPECHQRRLAQRKPADARAKAEQDNADILQRVVSQQPLDIVFHQRIQPADKRRQQTKCQQQYAPPQRRLPA